MLKSVTSIEIFGDLRLMLIAKDIEKISLR